MNLNAKNINLHKNVICRICGIKSKEPLISIYCGGTNNFALKIMFYLPIKIVSNDGLPLKLCTNCMDFILKWDDFYQTCVEADSRLKNMFLCNSSPMKTLTPTIYKPPCKPSRTLPVRGNLSVEKVYKQGITLSVAAKKTASAKVHSKEKKVKNGNPSKEEVKLLETLDIKEEVLVGEEVIFGEGGEEMSTEPSLSIRSITSEETFICPDCGLSFAKKETFAIHSLQDHRKHHALQSLLHEQLTTLDEVDKIGAKIGANCYRCKVCDRIFASPSKLKVHSRTHTGARPFKCLLCGKTFRQTSHTVTHMKLTHFNIRNYECEYCQKNFKDRSSYRMHKLTHRGKISYKGYSNFD